MPAITVYVKLRSEERKLLADTTEITVSEKHFKFRKPSKDSFFYCSDLVSVCVINLEAVSPRKLTLYGVKGVDWVDGEDFTYGGNTYKTWRYPDDKADEYLMKPPYTGKYMLLQNINVSNRIRGHYNTVEKKWFTSLYFDFPQYNGGIAFCDVGCLNNAF